MIFRLLCWRCCPKQNYQMFSILVGGFSWEEKRDVNQFTKPIADRFEQSTSECVKLIYLVKCCRGCWVLNDPDLDNLSPLRLSREIECNLGQVSVVRSLQCKVPMLFLGGTVLGWWVLQGLSVDSKQVGDDEDPCPQLCTLHWALGCMRSVGTICIHQNIYL